MAGKKLRGTSVFTTLKGWLHNQKVKRDTRICAKMHAIHIGTQRILEGGVWEDKDHNLYNAFGHRIGKIVWKDEEQEEA